MNARQDALQEEAALEAAIELRRPRKKVGENWRARLVLPVVVVVVGGWLVGWLVGWLAGVVVVGGWGGGGWFVGGLWLVG